MVDWNDIENSADDVEGWLRIYEKAVLEIYTTSRRLSLLKEQNTYFNRLFGNQVDDDILYLTRKKEDYEAVKDVVYNKIIELT